MARIFALMKLNRKIGILRGPDEHLQLEVPDLPAAHTLLERVRTAYNA